MYSCNASMYDSSILSNCSKYAILAIHITIPDVITIIAIIVIIVLIFILGPVFFSLMTIKSKITPIKKVNAVINNDLKSVIVSIFSFFLLSCFIFLFAHS